MNELDNYKNKFLDNSGSIVDRETIRDDILNEMFDKLNSMSTLELIALRDIVFKKDSVNDIEAITLDKGPKVS